MTGKLLRMARKDGTVEGYMHWCPACDQYHPIYVEEPNPHTGNRWIFNGNTESPTFSPSIRANSMCHYLIDHGTLEYLPDCLHPFAGKSMEMPNGDIS